MALFIVFEGGEGCGKSTQARALYRRLVGLGHRAILTHEPGGTPLGRMIRRWLKTVAISPKAELLLFNASRAQLVKEVIRPALERGFIVICDRFSDSTRAYQGYGRGLALEVVKTANDLATGGLRPDLVVLLDLPVEEGLARKGAGKGDRFEGEEMAFHHRVRQGYLEMAKADPGRWLVVDATLPRRVIQEIVWERVRGLLEASRPAHS